MTLRLGFLTTHPIQYQVPIFRLLAQRSDLEFAALFCELPDDPSGAVRTVVIHKDELVVPRAAQRLTDTVAKDLDILPLVVARKDDRKDRRRHH